MNRFLTLSVLSLLMLGNQSRAMELEQRKFNLKEKIFTMVSKDPTSLSNLNDSLLGSFNENDHADVIGIIIVYEKEQPNVCTTVIETLVEK